MERPFPAGRPGARDAAPGAGGLRVALNTQTPLVRFRDETVAEAGEGPIDLARLREPDDYKFTTGGVTRMVLPLLRRWLAEGVLADAEWVAMAAGDRAPPLRHDGVRLSFVGLPEAERRRYAAVKERMWALLNSNPSTPVPHGEGGVAEEAWAAFDAYQARSAEALAEAGERLGGLDLLYVHDFQQVGVGEAWRGPRVPKVFHLHTPFPSVMPQAWADYFVARLSRYDAVVVSTHRYAENLRRAGLRTPLRVIRPFIDPADQPAASPGDVRRFRERFALPDDAPMLLHVGRMDPMKGQDRLLRAWPRVLARVPEARLVLVGNGSFSSSRKGGLGLSKGEEWRRHLEALRDELGLGERVVFTGHLGDELLPAAYDACTAFCLPSTREGFGLAAVEAWMHRKPVVVCDRAGVSELVQDDVNGRVVDCAAPEALAEALVAVLADEDAARAMGEEGWRTSTEATLPVGSRALARLFREVMEGEKPLAR